MTGLDPASFLRWPERVLLMSFSEDDLDVLELAMLTAWKTMESEILKCTRCRLAETRTRVVPGEGPSDARIMFVGEGPGASEDAEGRPFVGRSGRFLTELMAEAALPRKSVFITNVVKCRPPENRNPRRDEICACIAWLERQIDLVHPDVLVTIGNVPTQRLLNTRTGISRLRGSFHDLNCCGRTIVVRPLFHPAYLLRNRSRKANGPVDLTLRDLMAVAAFL